MVFERSGHVHRVTTAMHSLCRYYQTQGSITVSRVLPQLHDNLWGCVRDKMHRQIKYLLHLVHADSLRKYVDRFDFPFLNKASPLT